MAPRVYRKRNAKSKPRRRVAGKRVARKSKAPSQYATITETIEYTDITSQSQRALVFNLSEFVRAGKVATCFRWYKASKVVWNISPLFNTFADGGAGGDTVPYMYRLMDRTQDNLGMNLADIQATGARPEKLSSAKVISYTPNWCSPGLLTYTSAIVPNSGGGTAITGNTQQGMKAQYSWLAAPNDNTLASGVPQYIVPIDPRDPPLIPPAPFNGMHAVNTNQVCYNGMDIFIDQQANAGEQTVARITATVTWQFKDPKFHTFVRDPEPPATTAFPEVV